MKQTDPFLSHMESRSLQSNTGFDIVRHILNESITHLLAASFYFKTLKQVQLQQI